jgi:hypothetical protein
VGECGGEGVDGEVVDGAGVAAVEMMTRLNYVT